MTTDRDTISRRIRALRQKTTANGCSEDEAIAAAEMLARLLEKHNMTLDEAELRASQFEQHTERHDDLVGDRLWKIADGVAYLTGCRYWQSRPGVFPVEINFFGFAHEVEVAVYMLEICAGAMRREQTRITEERWPRVVRRSHVLPFLDGMADRLRDRLRALKPPRPTGTGLIVLHDALVEQAMPVQTQDGRSRASRDRDDAYLDGLAAGDRVALNRGLRGAGGSVAGLLR